MPNDNQTELLQAAAAWHARLAAPDYSARDRAEFEAWHSEPLHAAAFARVQRTAAAVARDPRLQALADAAFADAAQPTRAAPRRWLRTAPLALAATLLLAIGVLSVLPALEHARTPAVTYVTPLDETQTVTLSDGSVVSLDVASSIEVRLGAQERRIELLAGRAYFKVAHDAMRPFTVTSANVHTEALGTQFQVQEARGEVSVTLLEGSVLVSDLSGARPQWQEKLRPGEQLRLAAGARAPERRAVRRETVAGWLRGRHVFEATPLAEAVEEINRYSARKIRLGDPSLAQLRIGGNFVAGDGAAIAAAIGAALPVELVEGGQEIILFRRHDPSP